MLASHFWISEVPPIGPPPCACMYARSICSRFEGKCNKTRQPDGFMIYQKHFTIWQSSLEQISKCLLYERKPEILLIRGTSVVNEDACVTWLQAQKHTVADSFDSWEARINMLPRWNKHESLKDKIERASISLIKTVSHCAKRNWWEHGREGKIKLGKKMLHCHELGVVLFLAAHPLNMKIAK